MTDDEWDSLKTASSRQLNSFFPMSALHISQQLALVFENVQKVVIYSNAT